MQARFGRIAGAACRIGHVRKFATHPVGMGTASTVTDAISKGGLTQIQISGQVFTLPSIFVRDSSVHRDHLHEASKQKLLCTTDVPDENTVTGIEPFLRNGQNHVRLHWKEPLRGVPPESRHISEHSVAFLREMAADHSTQIDLPLATPWTSREYASDVDVSPYDEWMSDDNVLFATLDDLIKKGITFLKDVPTHVESPALRDVIERIGSIRNTWYGELFDVRSVQQSLNIAYTNLDLGLHMDLVHFENPPRFQFLHSLQNTGVIGGESYFVDTFKVVEILEQVDPEALHTLATEPILFDYHNGDHHTRWAHPTVEYNRGRLWAVNYAPPFQGPLLLPGDESAEQLAARMTRIHSALSKFARICAQPEMQFHIQLHPGDCVIFDNRRVLHARKGFSFADVPGAGRWLKGGYLEGDELWSRWRHLEME